MTIARMVTIVSLTITVCCWAWIAYIKVFYTPPAPVPCEEGMTLMPGQSCFMKIEFHKEIPV